MQTLSLSICVYSKTEYRGEIINDLYNIFLENVG